MKLSQVFAEFGPLLVRQVWPAVEGESSELETQRELMLAAMHAISDGLQAQERTNDQIGKAKFLADLALQLIHGSGEVSDDQARAAVETAAVILDHAIEVVGRK